MTNTMQKVPYDIWSKYDAFLKAKVKDISQHENLKKWFLYFWDFGTKYHPPDSRSEQVSLFIGKLQDKKQSEAQQKQAVRADRNIHLAIDRTCSVDTLSLEQPCQRHGLFLDAPGDVLLLVPQLV